MFALSLKPSFVTDSLTTLNEFTNTEIKAVYKIVLKDFLRVKQGEITEIKDLKVEGCKTLEIRDFAIIGL